MSKPQVVLVSVLKNKADLKYLKKDNWYRIPVNKCPKRKFAYLAFFEPGRLSGGLGCIRYFGKPETVETKNGSALLSFPKDPQKKYFKLVFARLNRLKKPVTNKNGMRVSFGFTTLAKLKKAREVTELFDVAPIEKMIQKALWKRGLKIFPEFPVSLSGNRKYRLDFAIFCRKGALNVECDSAKWHSMKSQRIKDKTRDKELKNIGWSILRLKEREITGKINTSVAKIVSRVKTLGGAKR